MKAHYSALCGALHKAEDQSGRQFGHSGSLREITKGSALRRLADVTGNFEDSHTFMIAYYTILCNRVIMKNVIKQRSKTCPPKPELTARRLLSLHQAQVLESTFKLLANTTRLRMLHALIRAGELCVGELADTLGMKPQAVSNQLQRLADCGIVEARREGVQIRYSIIDPCVPALLHEGWCLAEDAQARTVDRTGAIAS